MRKSRGDTMKNRKLLFRLVLIAFFPIFICGAGGVSAAYTLNGTVEYKGQPISGVKVVLGGDKNSEITTGQNGTYSFNFGEGHYTVNYYSDDYLFDKQGFAFKVYDAFWGGGPSSYGPNADNKPWIAGITVTVNWEASFPLQSESGIAYTGAITEARVGVSNAEELAVTSYLGGAYSDIGRPRLTRVSPALANALTLMNILMGTSDTGTVSGVCGGTAAFTVDTDSQGNFAGEAVFNNFCHEGMVISGTVNFSGVKDAEGFILQEFIFDPIQAHSKYFDPIQAHLKNDDFELSGDITIEYVDPYCPFTITSNLFIRDTHTSKIYLLINYLIQGGYYTDRLEFNIGGKFYHPDFGYVMLSQVDPPSYAYLSFKIPTGENYPSEGGLIVRGGSGTAKLSAVLPLVYQIEVEIKNDFIDIDLNLGVRLWSNLYIIKTNKAMPWIPLLLLDD